MNALKKRLQALEQKVNPSMAGLAAHEMTDAQLMRILTAATERTSFTDEELNQLIEEWTA